MAQIVEHADGVYLNMTEEAYFADWAIGSTSLRLLVDSPPDWWWNSPFNTLVPHRENKDEDATKAQRFGSAVHCALLEGMDVFTSVYGVCPDKFTHPRALATAAELSAELKKIGEKVSGTKAEQIERLLAKDPAYADQILDCIIEEWEKQGRKPLSRVEYNKINLMERIMMGPKGKPTDLGKAFVGGLSEVSVFWTDEGGARQRARFDKLKPNATIDLKTFSNWQGRDFGKAMLRDAALKGYHIQASHYEEARRQLRRLVAEGRVFHPTSADPGLKAKIDADLALLQEIAAAETWRWVWVFYKTDGAPRAKGVIMNWKKTHANIIAEGDFKRAEAIANFHHYKSFYGLDQEGQMWRDPEQLWTPTLEDWPIYAQVAD
jgi:hypothetical protein